VRPTRLEVVISDPSRTHGSRHLCLVAVMGVANQLDQRLRYWSHLLKWPA